MGTSKEQMTSKLVSLAKVLFSFPKAAVSRSLPAFVGPLRRGISYDPPSDNDDVDDEDREESSETQEVTLDQTSDGSSNKKNNNNNNGVFLAELVTAISSAMGPAAGREETETPIASPMARHERREAIKAYYRTAIAGGSGGGDNNNNNNDNNNGPPRTRDVVEEPDLAVPIGDEFL